MEITNAFECLLAVWARLRCRQCPRVMSETHSVQAAYVCPEYTFETSEHIVFQSKKLILANCMPYALENPDIICILKLGCIMEIIAMLFARLQMHLT